MNTLKRPLLIVLGLIVVVPALLILFAETGLIFEPHLSAYQQAKWHLTNPMYQVWFKAIHGGIWDGLSFIVRLSLLLALPFYILTHLKTWFTRLWIRHITKKAGRALRKAGPSRLFLGLTKTKNKSAYISNKMRAEHMLILGSTGTGKTRSVLEPAICTDILWDRGMILLTAKEEPDFLSRIYSFVKAAGREEDLRIFTLSEPMSSHSYNPFIYGDAMALRDLCMEAFNWDNEYYRDQAKSALLVILDAFKQTEKIFTLTDLYYVITEKGCLEVLHDMTSDPQTKHHLKTYLDDWKTFRDNLRGLAANTEDYAYSKQHFQLADPFCDINLIEAHQKNQIVLFILNSLQYGETARRLGRLILQNIRYVAGLNARKQKHFFPVYIDEFHHFVYPEFFTMIAQCRSSNIGVTLATQSFADMKTRDWDITTQIIQNTNTKLILRQNDADSADLAARLAGTRQVANVTERIERHWWSGESKTGAGSLRQEEEFIIHPNMIRTLPTGEAALIMRGRAQSLQLFCLQEGLQPADIDMFERTLERRVTGEPLAIYDRWRAALNAKLNQGIRLPKLSTGTA